MAGGPGGVGWGSGEYMWSKYTKYMHEIIKNKYNILYMYVCTDSQYFFKE